MSKRANWSCRTRLWLENNSEVVLGRGRVELLEAIEQHHSIRRAAASMKMSYRRVWLLVQRANSASTEPLVEATKGGHTRGGASVTPFGKEAIRRFHVLDRAVRAAAERVMKRF